MYEERTIYPQTDESLLMDFRDLRVFRLSKKSRSADPIAMLDAVLTNNLPKDPRLGGYSLLLDAKGRIQTDVISIRDGEDVLLITESTGAAATLEILGRYAPFSRVKLEQTDLRVLGVYGPEAESLSGGDLAEYESSRPDPEDDGPLLFGVARPLKGVAVVSNDGSPPTETLGSHNVARMSSDRYETARISGAVPKFGVDITPDNFPAEAHLEERAVDFTKGCYPGQETVARMHYRGQPNKLLHRFAVEGEVSPGAKILQNDRDVGYITSVAPLPVDGVTFALGYLKRKADTHATFSAGDSTVRVSPPETR